MTLRAALRIAIAIAWAGFAATARAACWTSIGAGMRGDRAHIVFSRLEEISAFVKESCASTRQ
jgi:hypothetical protein